MPEYYKHSAILTNDKLGKDILYFKNKLSRFKIHFYFVLETF